MKALLCCVIVRYDIWGVVHRDVHPNPVTYDELWSFTVTYASAFKARWPNVRIAAPVSYGWCGYWSAGTERRQAAV
jgi:hypothetical protein